MRRIKGNNYFNCPYDVRIRKIILKSKVFIKRVNFKYLLKTRSIKSNEKSEAIISYRFNTMTYNELIFLQIRHILFMHNPSNKRGFLLHDERSK